MLRAVPGAYNSTPKMLAMTNYPLCALPTSHPTVLRASGVSEVVIHALSPTQVRQLAGVPGTLCPCALIPS